MFCLNLYFLFLKATFYDLWRANGYLNVVVADFEERSCPPANAHEAAMRELKRGEIDQSNQQNVVIHLKIIGTTATRDLL